jgi:hypothetical protein
MMVKCTSLVLQEEAVVVGNCWAVVLVRSNEAVAVVAKEKQRNPSLDPVSHQRKQDQEQAKNAHVKYHVNVVVGQDQDHVPDKLLVVESIAEDDNYVVMIIINDPIVCKN